ncbi:hypothetical protein BGX27_008973 [Mortierella sp. AM989]|nr:hypothetical protein BGX27_008973 [Mortierella sp. AM989]
MSQSETPHGDLDHSTNSFNTTSSNNDTTATQSTNIIPSQNTLADKGGVRSRIDRPKSSPSTVNNISSTRPPLTPSYSYASTSTASTARPPNAVVPGTSSRPKTSYHALTWKENLDAFNHRLRRGSLSLDAAAQEEEEQLLNSQNTTGYLDQSGIQQDEQTRLLGNADQSKLSYNNNDYPGSNDWSYGATTTNSAGLLSSSGNESSDVGGRLNRDENGSGPVFPTQLNPALATSKSSKLGVFSGVFVPCVLSIWGIILFLRFGFIIAQAGVVGTMAMFIVGYSITIFTTMSLSAISTNGTVRGGGVYYLLSRSLGPEFGGSIGLIYFLCTVVGGGMNVLGFVEPLISNFGESSGTVYRVLPESWGWSFVYGTILLISCTLVCLVGSKLFARSSLVLALVILLSTLSIFLSFAVMPPFTHPERNIEYTGFSWETLQENMWPKFTTTGGPEGVKQSFRTVFGVLFPACIGILAGASMSGDLEEPSKSIPKGTLWAVGSTFCAYTLIVILMGGSISRSTMYSDLSVLQDVSINPLFIASGALAASVFATLGSVIGSAKILQAIARDNLLPFLSVFGQGTPRTDEPTLAVLFTYILCQLCLFLTDMNAIATFVSLITLLTFLILNLACFLLKIGSAPNFRPSFRFFHWWTAFGGMLLCAVVMGFVDLGQTLLSGLMTAVLFIWIHYWTPPKRWGDVTQSLIYHQVRKYLLRLDSRKEHVKFWRPQILLLVHHPRSEYQLIQFCNHLKKGALYVLGHVILGDLRDVLTEYRRQQGSWLKFVDVLQIKAFVNLSVADSVRIGARNLLIGTGLGGMRPNIVVMGAFNLQRYLKEKREQQQLEQETDTPQTHPHSSNLQKAAFAPLPVDIGSRHKDHTMLNIPVSLPIDNIRVEAPIKITDYVSIIEDVLSLNKAVAIGYGFERLELPEEHKSNWRLFSSIGSGILPSSILPQSSSRASSMHKAGESKKKYIDLWPMQMSIAPLQAFDPSQQHPHFPNQKREPRDLNSSSPIIPGGGTFPESYGAGAGAYNVASRMAEGNLTNFDTYAMVLQMGCILHMVPQWKDNYLLRVMVFVEYKEDVEEEKKRLLALLENLRIPAEVKVMCLDGGDSETYARLVREGDMEMSSPVDYQFDPDMAEQEEGESYVASMAPMAQKSGPRNINPYWQQHALPEVEEEEEGKVADKAEGVKIQEDGQSSSHETGPYSNFAERRITGQKDDSPSSSRFVAGKPADTPHGPKSQGSGQLPQRRRTISHPTNSQQLQSSQSPSNLRVSTGFSPRSRQGSLIGASHAHPSTPQYYTGGASGLRHRNTLAGSMSPMESRLGTSAPLGGPMSFRIAVPLPRQYFDSNGLNSSGSESDSISSEDDEDYDHNDDDLVYGGLYPPQQLQNQQQVQHDQRQRQRLAHLSSPTQRAPQQQQTQTPQNSQQTSTGQQQTSQSAFAHTSIGSEHGLGIVLGDASTISEPDTIGYADRGQHDRRYIQPQHPFNPSTSPRGIMENSSNLWATSQDGNNHHSNIEFIDQGRSQEAPTSYSDSPPEGDPSSFSTLASAPVHADAASPRSPFGFAVPQAEDYEPSPQPPIQFDHLSPEAQLMIMNELMRIHSSAETTSIVFTTVPAPEVGTCLREQSSMAYLEKLDLMMDGIDIPVLLLHAKSLTVTMTL